MKRLLAVTLALVTLLCLAACGGGKADYGLYVGDNKIFIGDDAGETVKALTALLGEPKTSESPSCASSGMDTLYSFGGLIVRAMKDGNTETVYQMQLLDDSIQTSEHIRIGDTKEKVISVYGEPDAATETTMFYNCTAMHLAFRMKDGCVTIIEYRQGLHGEE